MRTATIVILLNTLAELASIPEDSHRQIECLIASARSPAAFCITADERRLGAMTHSVDCMVNGRGLTVVVADDELLCDLLREKLGLMGTRVGCREGVCGSCNVLVDGMLVRSCLTLAAQIEGCQIRTVESLSEGGRLSPVQQAFVDYGAVQCGFCTAGLLVTVTALLEDNPRPADAEIVEALAGNICRCTGYRKILAAVRAAAGRET